MFLARSVWVDPFQSLGLMGAGGRQPIPWRRLDERLFGSVDLTDDEVVKVNGVELFVRWLQSDEVPGQRVRNEDGVTL